MIPSQPHRLARPILRYVLAAALLLTSALAQAAPRLFFSDLVSGPRAGNTDTTHGAGNGAIVTVWGKNLGDARGTSTIAIGGVAVPTQAIYYWGRAIAHGGGADLYTRQGMQMIEFAIPGSSVPLGAVNIVVTVGNEASNGLPFTTRDQGKILFVSNSGTDSTAATAGSWSTPFRTVQYATDRAGTGDVFYVLDGVNTSGGITISNDGASTMHKALVAYPGATATLGSTTSNGGLHVWNSSGQDRSKYWTIAKLRFPGASTGYGNMNLGDGFRAVGNYVTNPRAEGLTGSVTMGGDGFQYNGNIYVLGNELTGNATDPGFVPDKMYHAIYLSGKRQDGAHAPSMKNVEVAWNYIHDNNVNRGINIYSEQDGCSFIEEVKIHDNYIINQRGDGILVGKAITGTANLVYNNVIISAGLGPLWRNNEISSNSGIRISAGWPGLPAAATRVGVYNNTIYGGGYAANTASAAIYWDPSDAGGSWLMTLDYANNLVSITDAPYWSGNAPVLPSAPNLWYGKGARPTWNSGGIVGDPLFVSGTDLHVKSGSPAIDAGIVTSVAQDFDGTSRPQGTKFDLGAFEYATQSNPGSGGKKSALPILNLILD